MFKKGDRIRLVRMDDDPNPIPVGTEGTIIEAVKVDWPRPYIQLMVDWDNGRTLSPCIPPDQVQIL